MWDLPGPRLEPASPALAGRPSTTAPPGKPLNPFFTFVLCSCLMECPINAGEVKFLVVLFKSSVVLLESFSSYLLLPLPTLLLLIFLKCLMILGCPFIVKSEALTRWWKLCVCTGFVDLWVIRWLNGTQMGGLINACISESFLFQVVFLWRRILWGQEGEGLGISLFREHITPLTSTRSSPLALLCPQKIPVWLLWE